MTLTTLKDRIGFESLRLSIDVLNEQDGWGLNLMQELKSIQDMFLQKSRGYHNGEGIIMHRTTTGK